MKKKQINLFILLTVILLAITLTAATAQRKTTKRTIPQKPDLAVTNLQVNWNNGTVTVSCANTGGAQANNFTIAVKGYKGGTQLF
ncbi:MAG: hypothetical protein ABIH00_10440, partial [Armatimonadota bacterium]